MSDDQEMAFGDFSKLDIRDGVIHYRLYQQDGDMIDMSMPDCLKNRFYVSWMKIHDRYDGVGK